MATIFLNTSLPPSQEFGFWGRIYRAINGRGGGKFGQSLSTLAIVDPKVILVDVSPGELMTVAMTVPHLNTVISTGAELFSLMEIKHLDKNKQEIENSPILKFLKKPNPVQTQEEYLYQFYVLNSVYNKTFQHKITAAFEKTPRAMWLLPSGWMKLNLTGKVYRQTSLSEIIKNFEMMGDNIPYDVDKVIYMAEGIGHTVLNPVSRIEALQIPLSNIVASLKSTNIIITERGMIGFMSPDVASKDSEGQLPFDENEHKRIRKEYQSQYNLDGMGGHVGFPKIPMKWVPMTFDVKQLGLTETNEEAFQAIVAAYRHDRDIYPSTKGATFENKSAGLKSTFQNGLQPLADKLMRQWTDNFLDPNSGESLVASYEYLPCMQEDQKEEAEAKYFLAKTADILLKNGTIDHNTVAAMCDVEMTGDKVVIQSTAPKTTDNGKEEI